MKEEREEDMKRGRWKSVQLPIDCPLAGVQEKELSELLCF